jgi:hypothetical protein
MNAMSAREAAARKLGEMLRLDIVGDLVHGIGDPGLCGLILDAAQRCREIADAEQDARQPRAA